MNQKKHRIIIQFIKKAKKHFNQFDIKIHIDLFLYEIRNINNIDIKISKK